jgi:ankyrin repeat protein
VTGVEAINTLIVAGADVNQTNVGELDKHYEANLKDGETPIFAAIGNIDKAKLLVEHGADVKVTSGRWITPLHLVRDARVTQLFLENGADPDAKDNFDNTPLHKVRDPDSATLMIKQGADINARNHIKATPLMRNHNFDVKAVLIEAGADINALDKWGKTALHSAETSKVVDLLIDSGAECTVISSSRQSRPPLFEAIANGRFDAGEAILNYCGYSLYRDRRGHSALDVAKTMAHRNKSKSARLIVLLEDANSLSVERVEDKGVAADKNESLEKDAIVEYVAPADHFTQKAELNCDLNSTR